MPDNKKNIIDRLIEVRTETGLPSKDFAAKAGIDTKNYSSIENGKRSIGERVMNDICLAFNINFVWLKTGNGEKYIANSFSSNVQSDSVLIPREVFDQIARLTETILSQQQIVSSQQQTIDYLCKKIPVDTAAGV